MTELFENLDFMQAFGWSAVEVDGHSYEELIGALSENNQGKPLCVIANTTKGKGISFMENSVLWHYRSPQGEEFKSAQKELDDA